MLLATLGGMIAACTHPPKFAGFDIKPHDGDGPTFHFSDADATASSPVVMIAVPDRLLTSADDRKRMEIEKVWLSTYVAKPLAFRGVGSALCHYSRHGEHPFCEFYEFEDAREGRRYEYYFYVGNWPVANGGTDDTR